MKFKSIAAEIYPGISLQVLTKDEFLNEAPAFLYNPNEVSHLAQTYYKGPVFEIRREQYEVDYFVDDFFNLAIAFRLNNVSLGHLVYTCGFVKKQGVYTLEKSDVCLTSKGLVSGQASVLEAIIKLNNKFDFINWMKGTNGNFHVYNRLPDGLEIDGNLDMGSFFEAKRIPHKLKVVGDVTDHGVGSKTLPKSKVPTELNVTGNMNVTQAKIGYLPEKLSVTGTLTITTKQKIGTCECHALTITSGGDTPAPIDLGRFTVGEGGVTIDGTTKGIKNIRTAGDVTVSLNDTCESITNVETKGTLYVYRSLALKKLGPDIRCQTLSIYRGNIEDTSEVNVSGMIDIERSHSTKFLPPNLVLQQLKIKECDSIKLPEHGLVYGDMTVPKRVTIPQTFCCLGKVSVTD